MLSIFKPSQRLMATMSDIACLLLFLVKGLRENLTLRFDWHNHSTLLAMSFTWESFRKDASPRTSHRPVVVAATIEVISLLIRFSCCYIATNWHAELVLGRTMQPENTVYRTAHIPLLDPSTASQINLDTPTRTTFLQNSNE